MRRPIRLAVLGAVALALVQSGWVAGAQSDPATDGPTITLDRYSIEPGGRVLVTLDGFEGTAVTISVCGNQARRGSVDCNMTASEGLGLDTDGSSTLTEFPVAAPAAPCPCLIRASTLSFDELAVAPIELLGHPIGPVVGAPALEPLDISVAPRRASRGIVASIRSAIGGPTAYDVTVSVRNRSTETLEHVVLAGSAGRSREDDMTTLELPAPGRLEPGQTWEKVVRSEIPAPVLGGFVWHVTASGAGPGITVEETTRVLPVGLVILALIFAVDVGAIVWRRVARRRLRRRVDVAGVPLSTSP